MASQHSLILLFNHFFELQSLLCATLNAGEAPLALGQTRQGLVCHLATDGRHLRQDGATPSARKRGGNFVKR